jgi:hypothetical protein
MSKKLKEGKTKSVEDIEVIAEKAERGEDVSKSFTRRYVAKQRVNVDFTLEMLDKIDAECRRLGVTRQAWIKVMCDQQLRSAHKDILASDNVAMRATG